MSKRDEATPAPKWTREEFEARCNSGHGVDWRTRERGRLSIQCYEYDDHGCHGWKMSHLDWLEDEMQYSGNTQEEIDKAITYRLEVLEKGAPND